MGNFATIEAMKNNQKGQTSIEYALLLGVVVIIVLSFSSKIREYMVGEGPCPNQSLLCHFIGQQGYLGFYFQGNFRYFSIKR